MAYQRRLTNIAGAFTLSQNDPFENVKKHLFWTSPIGRPTDEEIAEKQRRDAEARAEKRYQDSKHLMLRFCKRVVQALEKALVDILPRVKAGDKRAIREQIVLLEAIRYYARRYEHFQDKYLQA